MTDRGKEFADLAYSIVVTERRFAMKRIAADMGMGYDALHARIVNRTPFSADEIRRLIRAAPDPRFVGWLLRDTRFVAAERLEVGAETDPDLEAIHLSATRIVLEAADVLEAVEEALVETGPDRAVHGVVRWRRVDPRQAVEERFGVAYHERTTGKIPKALGFSHVGTRPRASGTGSRGHGGVQKTPPGP